MNPAAKPICLRSSGIAVSTRDCAELAKRVARQQMSTRADHTPPEALAHYGGLMHAARIPLPILFADFVFHDLAAAGLGQTLPELD